MEEGGLRRSGACWDSRLWVGQLQVPPLAATSSNAQFSTRVVRLPARFVGGDGLPAGRWRYEPGARAARPRRKARRSAGMASRGDLTEFERGVIVGARLGGASVTQAAEMANVSRGTVSKVMSAWEREGKTSSAKGNCGRKRLLSARDTHALVQLVRRNRRATAEELWEKFNAGREQRVSLKTIRRELHRAGYYWQVAEQRGMTWDRLEDKDGTETGVTTPVPVLDQTLTESQLDQSSAGVTVGQQGDVTEHKDQELLCLEPVPNTEQTYDTPRRGCPLTWLRQDPIQGQTETSQDEGCSVDRGKGRRTSKENQKKGSRAELQK
ncbi:uncharacterized protein LOC108934881 [Scleropages formosus]|uniref:Uncharacterized LOC108934881 n=1 Tax=Scleropages formosus TaxID=113540 RepID=A0A8C9SXV2_SCLFO|nr:uncharacterized protein LOC108934881 [Scleropages formosus]